MSLEHADLLVLGGGTAGLVAAQTAAALGADVWLVEAHRTGGDCLWTGCIPSKSLLAAASVAAAVRRGPEFGITTADLSVDFPRVLHHVRDAIATIAPVDSPEALTEAGVTVLRGSARFTDPRTVTIGARSITFTHAVLATGARPAIPPIAGLKSTDYLTSETLWEITELPTRLLVLGGGSIGCEMAQAFARLGSHVTLVESAQRLLPHEDPAASTILTAALTAEGITVLTGADALSINGTRLTLADGQDVEFDRLLIAAGRTPRTDGIGLEDAGIVLEDNGNVRVDDFLRTTNGRVFAAGDLTGHPQFTHTAGVHGSIAAGNAVLGLRRRVDKNSEPRVTFTDPEIAAVGITPHTAERIDGLRVETIAHTHLDRAIAEARTDGLTSLVLDGKHRIVGASIIGPRAGETIGEIALAVKHGLRTRDLVAVTHPYPTYNDGPWNAAIADVRSRLAQPGTARLIRAAARLRRAALRKSDRKNREGSRTLAGFPDRGTQRFPNTD